MVMKKILVLFIVLIVSFIFVGVLNTQEVNDLNSYEDLEGYEEYLDSEGIDYQDFDSEDYEEYLEDFGSGDVDVEEILDYMEEHDITSEDIQRYMEEHDISPEEVQRYMDEYGIDYEDVGQIVEEYEVEDAFAQHISSELIMDTFYQNLGLVKEGLNYIIGEEIEIPGIVSYFYGNKSFELVLGKNDGNTHNVFFDFEDNYLKNLTQEQIREKIDISIYVSQNAIDTVLESQEINDFDEMLLIIQELFRNKDLDFKIHGVWNNIKYQLLTYFKFFITI